MGGSLVADAANYMLVLSFSLIAISSLMILTISLLGSNGICLVLRKADHLTKLIDCKTSADIPQVPASAGLLPEATRFQSSTTLFSKILLTRFAKTIG